MVILVNTWDKLVLDDRAVFIPVLPVLLRAPLKVTSTPVDEDGDEEDTVKVRNRSSSANDSAPKETHDPVGDVVGFARIPPPSAGQKAVSMSGLNKGRVLDGTPRELRESLAVAEDALSLHLKSTLL